MTAYYRETDLCYGIRSRIGRITPLGELPDVHTSRSAGNGGTLHCEKKRYSWISGCEGEGINRKHCKGCPVEDCPARNE